MFKGNINLVSCRLYCLMHIVELYKILSAYVHVKTKENTKYLIPIIILITSISLFTSNYDEILRMEAY